jgi:hypothetical protein
MTLLDQGMNLPSDQIDPGQQAERAMAPVFMIAPGAFWGGTERRLP